MTNDILLYAGAGVIFLWGAAHVARTRGVVAGFGELSPDNRRIITMEGLALCFVGALVFLTRLLLNRRRPRRIPGECGVPARPGGPLHFHRRAHEHRADEALPLRQDGRRGGVHRGNVSVGGKRFPLISAKKIFNITLR
jgi:hypothetical protein